jgi:hypothetical protein
MTAITIINSISVKARQRIFIGHLVDLFQGNPEHGNCQRILRAKWLLSQQQGMRKA